MTLSILGSWTTVTVLLGGGGFCLAAADCAVVPVPEVDALSSAGTARASPRAARHHMLPPQAGTRGGREAPPPEVTYGALP